MRGRLSTGAVVAVVHRVIVAVAGLLLVHPRRIPAMISSLPRRVVATCTRWCGAHSTNSHPREGGGGNTNRVDDRLVALESEVKSIREAIQEEFKMLRELLLLQQQPQTGSFEGLEFASGVPASDQSDRLVGKGFNQSMSYVALAPSADGGRRSDKDTIIAAVQEAVKLVFELAGDLLTENSFWDLYSTSTTDVYFAASHDKERARRKVLVCQNDAETSTRNAWEHLKNARDRARELYQAVSLLQPPPHAAHEDDPIAALRDLDEVLNRAVETVEETTTATDLTVTMLLDEEGRDAFYGSLNESEDRLKKALRAMDG